VDSLLSFFRVKKVKKLRFFRKKLFGLLHKRYYYLFLHKHYIFNLYKKRRNKQQKKIISYNFKYRTYSKIFVNKKFFANRRRKRWRQVYFIRKRRRTFLRTLLYGFDNKIFNKILLKTNKNAYSFLVLKDYLEEYSAKLANKHIKDKNFFEKFFSKRRLFRRFKNIVYFYKWKKKEFFFCFSSFFKKNKNIKKIIFSLIWTRLFYKKNFWRRKKNSKKFLLFYYNNFFFNKTFIFFNSILKANFCFVKSKNWKKIKNKKHTIYIKKIRRRLMLIKIKRKFIRFFLFLLFFKIMKKHKKPSKNFIFKNAFFLSAFKKAKLGLVSSVLLGKDPFYFKNHSLYSGFEYSKENLKIISIL
jgi:hypothetical protein